MNELVDRRSAFLVRAKSNATFWFARGDSNGLFRQ